MQVLKSYVIYKRLPNEEKTSSGLLVLPETQRYANILAEVIAVGPGNFTEDGELEYMGNLRPGDIILIDQQSGRPVDKECEYCDISEVAAKVQL